MRRNAASRRARPSARLKALKKAQAAEGANVNFRWEGEFWFGRDRVERTASFRDPEKGGPGRALHAATQNSRRSRARQRRKPISAKITVQFAI